MKQISPRGVGAHLGQKPLQVLRMIFGVYWVGCCAFDDCLERICEAFLRLLLIGTLSIDSQPDGGDASHKMVGLPLLCSDLLMYIVFHALFLYFDLQGHIVTCGNPCIQCISQGAK